MSVLLLMKDRYFLVREKKSLQQNQKRNISGKKMGEKSRKRKEETRSGRMESMDSKQVEGVQEWKET